MGTWRGLCLPMDMHWKELRSLDRLKEIEEISKKRPVLIFKHSTRCMISRMVESRLEREWTQADADRYEIYHLDLLAHRDLSNAISKWSGVEHASPQLLIIRNGICIYNASHLDIHLADIIHTLDRSDQRA